MTLQHLVTQNTSLQGRQYGDCARVMPQRPKAASASQEVSAGSPEWQLLPSAR